MAVPLAGAFASGTYEAAVDVAGLAPGVYVVRSVANTAGVAAVRTARLTVEPMTLSVPRTTAARAGGAQALLARAGAFAALLLCVCPVAAQPVT